MSRHRHKVNKYEMIAPPITRCEKRRCNIGEILTEEGLCSVLRCQNGFEPGPSGTCVDVDECADYDGACGAGQRCENTLGSFRCVGECELGLRMDPVRITRLNFALET